MATIKTIALIILALMVSLALPLLLPPSKPPSGDTSSGMPWQIEILPDGATRVFGMVPGRTTLEEAKLALHAEPEVALLLGENDTGSIEAYVDSQSFGPLTGKLILTVKSSLEQRKEMLARAQKGEYMKSVTKRITLSKDDLAQVMKTPLAAITFIPAAQLDEAIVLERFGSPKERIRNSDHTEHFLYPEEGLDIQLDAKGRELLQYVSPTDFNELRRPLQAEKQDKP